MRILHILNHVQEVGNGIVNVAVDLACLQAENGHNVSVVSAGGEYEVLLAKYTVKHFNLNQTRTPINIMKAAWRYQRIIQEFQPDVVHAHMMTGVVLARLWKGFSKYALVSTVHNEFQRSAVLMGYADRIIAVSHAVAKSMARRGIPQNKLKVISNGTLGSVRMRNLQEYVAMKLQKPAIVTVAGMYKRKGISELISAFTQIASHFPDAHLYLVGDGPDKTLFEQQAQSTPFATRIHFTGFQKEPQSYMLGCDVFVLASHRDPSPLVIPEAREAGCAIIGCNVDGIPEALDDGRAGILIPPADSQALAEALKQLLGSPDLMHQWKKLAQQNLDRLNVMRVNDETMSVYLELTTPGNFFP
ncbi:MAG: glycosyltransferase family 4 protein [Scytonema sp. RU_4_4]|nr:glycosyltransferase family 4 protein [Scytonema sp. RU_4_4]